MNFREIIDTALTNEHAEVEQRLADSIRSAISQGQSSLDFVCTYRQMDYLLNKLREQGVIAYWNKHVEVLEVILTHS